MRGKDNIKIRLSDKIEVDFKNRNDLYSFANNALMNFDSIEHTFEEYELYYLYSDVISKYNNILFNEYIKTFIKQVKRNYQKEEI